MRYITFLGTCFLLFIPAPAYAQMTGLEIERFFTDIEELYNQKKPDMKKIQEQKALYMSEDFLSKMEARSNLGDKVIYLEQNREEVLADLDDKTNELLNSNISHTITDIRYEQDKMNAEVDYTSLFKGDIKTEKEDLGMVIIKFKALSVCTEALRLVDGDLKSYRSDCKTDLLYSKPEPIE